ncbi:MAG: acetylglutamate kinase [Candidatus Omnitrophica bacterium]|nr:acetylglutamate kinase [Candidatus Omnitrophota bacterium]
MEDAINKSKVLIEAMPYIKKFSGKIVVIKFGGNSLGDDAVRKAVLQDIVFMSVVGMCPVLVHGGGPHINKKLKESGIEFKFVKGLRVTDIKTMAVVDEALTEVNHILVEELQEMGAKAFGLIGKENKLLIADKINSETDIGYAGSVESVDTTVVSRLITDRIIPVISPVSIGKDRCLYNVNADEAASKIAVGLCAEKLVVLTNVDGVQSDKKDPGSLLHSISFKDAQYLMEKGKIEGGMIPKVQACLHALDGGVKKSHMVNAELKHALLLEIFTHEGIGTEIIKIGHRTEETKDI